MAACMGNKRLMNSRVSYIENQQTLIKIRD